MDEYIAIFTCCVLENSVANLNKNQIIIMDVRLTKEEKWPKEEG